ncbi:hypothetical protein [Saccharopolyspora sp. NPDC002376]
MTNIYICDQTDKQLAGILTERINDYDHGMGSMVQVLEELVATFHEKNQSWTSREVLEELAGLLEVEEMDTADYPDLDATVDDDEDGEN